MSVPKITPRVPRIIRTEENPYKENHPGHTPLTRAYFDDGSSSLMRGDHRIFATNARPAKYFGYHVDIIFEEDPELGFVLQDVSLTELYWLMPETPPLIRKGGLT